MQFAEKPNKCKRILINIAKLLGFLILFPLALLLVVPLSVAALACVATSKCLGRRTLNVCLFILIEIFVFCLGLAIGVGLNFIVVPLVIVIGIPWAIFYLIS